MIYRVIIYTELTKDNSLVSESQSSNLLLLFVTVIRSINR